MKTTSTAFRVAVLHAAAVAALFGLQSAGGARARAAAAQEAKAKTCSVDMRTWAGRRGTLYKQSYALVVGESDYKNWPDLQGTKHDVIAVKEALEKHGFTVKVLIDPTRKEFEEAVKEFKSKHDLSNPARFLFYFAGHGYTDRLDGRELGYIVTSDAPLPDKDRGGFRATAVSMMEMDTLARTISSCHALFVFDSCFSGTLFNTTMPTMRSAPIPILARMQPVRMFVTAGAEQVPDESIFREAFVKALNGEADSDEDGYVTGSELGEFLVNTVSKGAYGAQTPRYGKIRDPALDKGDFVFEVQQKEDTPGTTALPFMLETQYYPSGWMGDLLELKGTGRLTITAQTETVEGKPAVATRIEYRQGENRRWAGIYWQHPENNWGEKPGLDLTGAKQISFYARGERGGEIVEFISGGVALGDANKPHADRYKKSLGKIPLTNKWTKYVIDLSKVPPGDLKSVVGAFAWVAVGGYDEKGRLVTYIAELKVE